jgi:hypothetical protein
MPWSVPIHELRYECERRLFGWYGSVVHHESHARLLRQDKAPEGQNEVDEKTILAWLGRRAVLDGGGRDRNHADAPAVGRAVFPDSVATGQEQ